MDEQKRSYLTIKVATEMFELNPQHLTSQQLGEVEERVERVNDLQQKILNAPEAAEIDISSEELQGIYQLSVERFPSKEEFFASLQAQSLSEKGLKLALADELKCEKVMELVSQQIPSLDPANALAYFEKNRLEFSRAKKWEMSQILITINDDYAENTRATAMARIHSIAKQVTPRNFAQLALEHSECPSALENGNLGWCEEGKLFPEITNALYTLQPGQISQPIETEIGFHIVLFHDQKEPRVATFEEALPFLQEKHAARARHFLQKQWIAQLIKQP
ncbi:peptidylprolyl isomerase [Vibrio sp. RC27]